MPGFIPTPSPTPDGSATELDGVPMGYAPPAVPPAPATEVDGVPVDWAAPPAVPSGSATVLNPSSWLLTVTAAGDIGDTWTLWVNGTPVEYTVGSDEWVLTVLTPGTTGDLWEVEVAPGLVAQYTVQALDTAALVAAGLDAALELLAGVTSASVGAAVTFALDSGANFTPSASTDGAGTHTLSGVAAKDTATEVAAELETAFDAALDVGASDFAMSRAGAAMTVTRDAPGGYLNAELETDGTGTSTRAGTGTPMNFTPPASPPATATEVDGVPVTWEDPPAVPGGGSWVVTQS